MQAQFFCEPLPVLRLTWKCWAVSLPLTVSNLFIVGSLLSNRPTLSFLLTSGKILWPEVGISARTYTWVDAWQINKFGLHSLYFLLTFSGSQDSVFTWLKSAKTQMGVPPYALPPVTGDQVLILQFLDYCSVWATQAIFNFQKSPWKIFLSLNGIHAWFDVFQEVW